MMPPEGLGFPDLDPAIVPELVQVRSQAAGYVAGYWHHGWRLVAMHEKYQQVVQPRIVRQLFYPWCAHPPEL